MATIARTVSEFVDSAARLHDRARDLQAAVLDASGAEVQERMAELAELCEQIDAQRAVLTVALRHVPD